MVPNYFWVQSNTTFKVLDLIVKKCGSKTDLISMAAAELFQFVTLFAWYVRWLCKESGGGLLQNDVISA